MLPIIGFIAFIRFQRRYGIDMSSLRRKQNGATLIMALILLIILSLMAVSGMQNSIMQERMASSQRDGLVALEVAESGLLEVQVALEGLTDLVSFGSVTGYYLPGTAPDMFNPASWQGASSATASAFAGLTPRFFVEYRGPVPQSGQMPQQASSAPPQLHSARIVVMARGPSGQSQRMLESFYVFNLDP